MTRGKFITLEGGEGVGKTTNLEFIRDYLQRRGIRFLVTREPGGTPIGEAIRRLVIDSQGMSARTELLLMFAARAQHIEEVIEPALAKGIWIVCDRFTDASYAYQGGGRGIDNAVIRFLQEWLQKGLEPDLTLLFDAPVEVGLQRAKGRGQLDRFETELPAFFSRVRETYCDLARQWPHRIKLLDATQPLEDVQAEIARHLDSLRQT
ncbi:MULTISPECIES: dTMP kinase [Methylocaldum]|jgi:dTMP kinase|uniref:dTMP kinase n=1 Tax=unclassified Methylocaldum TaxID=2622260 RepID=UPI000A31F048|nr:dTMP kinase [Methylocaldum sp. RMAD-M]MBP1151882.1 dTMP kinase [Methylocaldum sp. RMAD-M]MDV3240694.1 dTMP kinase [Methylocaldum sp.]MVF22433.1 dTMP kinase [Methylocaldum sp. BRCS4]